MRRRLAGSPETRRAQINLGEIHRTGRCGGQEMMQSVVKILMEVEMN